MKYASDPHRDFVFVFSGTLYLILTRFFVFIVPHFAFCLYLQHAAETPMLPAGFFIFILLFSLCTLTILVSLPRLSWILPFFFTLQHTQHKHPCSQRNSNPPPQQRAATDLRRRPSGHRDRQESNPPLSDL